MNPNSDHQIWSAWTFSVHEAGRHVPRADVELNVARWLRAGFGSVGEVRVRPMPYGWRIEALVEGAPAHDTAYVESVRLQFQQRFVAQGWGPLASGSVTVKVMAGDVQDGKPPAQVVIVPQLRLSPRFWSA